MKIQFALALLVLAGSAHADVEMRFTDGTVGLVSDGRVMFGDDSGGALFVPGEEGMIVISHEQRTWTRLKPGFANAMASQMQAQMEAMLAGVPPEQRAMVEQQMAGMMPGNRDPMPKMKIRRTGNSADVAGYDCDEAEIVAEDGSVEEIVCVATADELDISGRDFDALIGAMEGMAEIAAMGGERDPQMDFRALGGIPVRTRERVGAPASELLSIDTSGIDANRLKIPDGYREASLDALMGQ